MTERAIWIFATLAGHKGTHPGNSSHISAPFQVFSAGFHHWGIFVADELGDPSRPKDEKKSYLGRFASNNSASNDNSHAIQGTFFELTRARDRDIDTLTRTRDVREREERDNAKWITFASTGCTTARTDDEITYIGKLICRENMSSDYALVGENCQDWVNIPQRTLQDIGSKLSWSRAADPGRTYGHSTDAAARVPFGMTNPGPGLGTGASSLSREEYQAQVLSQAQKPNNTSPESLAVSPHNPTIEMVDPKGFTVLICSYNGEHRRAVKELADSMRIRPTFLVRMSSHEAPIDFSIRRFKDACLIGLGGKDAELAVNVGSSSVERKNNPGPWKVSYGESSTNTNSSAPSQRRTTSRTDGSRSSDAEWVRSGIFCYGSGLRRRRLSRGLKRMSIGGLRRGARSPRGGWMSTILRLLFGI
ncbi:hypothetical protein M409DRAFT_53124 [Zasmidium cellare ATCC 36951]|uniref:Uncharacterized protein n=1 Tax=Zasmidium cellare ATCC 36951 TaxID=1080233 RepID=A0A6A6CMR7_ZASCE|nr:uncharacterized protein M409DRAFT_53124 [Zasmidium cellare ATCC 36951]KAF2168445.1 hypothetical protein M409DRAFT_53124 [Zasmidium cellare ATCC 36951]